MKGEKAMKEKIKPDLLGGFRDYLPEVMIAKQDIIDRIRKSCEIFGFLPQDTPCLERSSVLGTDVDEFKMEVYRFKDSYGGVGQDVTLRFDLTVPLARVIAAYPKLLKPYKRYQVGPVWRKEKPQSGRFREFTQFDADIVGSDSILADVEIVQLMYFTLKNLGIDDFKIKFNNRKILNGLPAFAGFEDKKASDVFRALDKLEKAGFEEVAAELGRQPENELDTSALALTKESINKIAQFINLSGKPEDVIKELKVLFNGIKIAEQGIAECEQIIYYLNFLKIPEDNWMFDLSVARGLGYYTGPVFETILTDLPEIGSVFSGGRYDELVMRFTGEKIPATGASIGVDRLIAALEKIKKLSGKKATAKVIFVVIEEKSVDYIMKLAQELRSRNVATEIFLGKGDMIKNQIIYAAKREIPYVAIIGEEENRAGKIKLKDMNRREEVLLTEKEFIDKLQVS